jgi:hypothetical protein
VKGSSVVDVPPLAKNSGGGLEAGVTPRFFCPQISQIQCSGKSASSAKSADEKLRVTPAFNPPSLFFAKGGTVTVLAVRRSA